MLTFNSAQTKDIEKRKKYKFRAFSVSNTALKANTFCIKIWFDHEVKFQISVTLKTEMLEPHCSKLEIVLYTLFALSSPTELTGLYCTVSTL